MLKKKRVPHYGRGPTEHKRSSTSPFIDMRSMDKNKIPCIICVLLYGQALNVINTECCVTIERDYYAN